MSCLFQKTEKYIFIVLDTDIAQVVEIFPVLPTESIAGD